MKIIIIYHYIAHYRLPIFQELRSSNKLKIDFAAGIKTDSSIKVLTPDILDFEVLKNKWLFSKKVLWQKGILSLVLRRYDHYIFLGNPYFLTTWFSLMLCKILGKKASIWTHGVTFDLSPIKKLIFKLLWLLSDSIYVYGHYAKNKMIDYGVCEEKITVIYNSLDYKKQLEVRSNFKKSNIFLDHFDNDDPVLIFTGRLTKIKKLNQILEAMKVLKDDGVNCNLIFVGDGSEKENLLKLATKLSLKNRVWFYGACYDENAIGNFFMNAKLCIAPGNVGLTAMHSLVYGTPVITHSDFQAQMPEFEAIEEGLTGSFFKKNDIQDLAQKIKFWLEMENKTFFRNREICLEVIKNRYNPIRQREILEKSLVE